MSGSVGDTNCGDAQADQTHGESEALLVRTDTEEKKDAVGAINEVYGMFWKLVRKIHSCNIF